MNTPAVTHTLIDTEANLIDMLEALQSTPASPPSLFLDLEGVNLSRHGTVSILTIFNQRQNHVYLVDIHTLQSTAFATSIPGIDTTLKSILETPGIAKVFFDVRNDSDALYSHFGIRLQGVEDVQLMENATRPNDRREYVCGLDRCIQYDAPLSPTEKLEWKAAKQRGVELFHPSKGGSFEVFNQRPLTDEIVRYCVNDVVFLAMLRDVYWEKLENMEGGRQWAQRVEEETRNRVALSQDEDYEPQGEDKCYGPWGDLGHWD